MFVGKTYLNGDQLMMMSHVCIAPPTRRPRAHHRVGPYLCVRRQNEV